MLYNRALSDEEIAEINHYLSEKYGYGSKAVSDIFLKEEGQDIYTDSDTPLVLDAVTVPMDAKNSKLVWKSSNPDVAVVDRNGKVTPVGLGHTEIGVTDKDGLYSASCRVYVKASLKKLLWQDIQNMKEWSVDQNIDEYSNWNLMKTALEQSSTVSEKSSETELLVVYQVLKTAMLSLEKNSVNG